MLEALLQESYLTPHAVYRGEDPPGKYFAVPVHSTAVLTPHCTVFSHFCLSLKKQSGSIFSYAVIDIAHFGM